MRMLVLVALLSAQFEVASIRENITTPGPGLLSGSRESVTPQGDVLFSRVSLYRTIAIAYGVNFIQMPHVLVVPPAFEEVLRKRFDIQAKGGEGTVEERLQELLTRRFALQAHWEMQERNVWAVTGKGEGPYLKPAPLNCLQHVVEIYGTKTPRSPLCTSTFDTRDGVRIEKSAGTIAELVEYQLQNRFQELVVDLTGLEGNFAWELAMPRSQAWLENPTRTVKEIERQLGLTLERRKMPWKVLVIDQVEMPTPN